VPSEKGVERGATKGATKGVVNGAEGPLQTAHRAALILDEVGIE
jgi:hypothetical protein